MIPIVLTLGVVASIAALTATTGATFNPNTYPAPIDMNAQVLAFLAVIRAGESSDNYGAYVGGGSFSDFSHHPATGANPWPGIAGPSHACGAYQFEPQTWIEAQSALGLPDFSPASQDAAAVFLIKRRNAYSAIVSGDIATACGLLKNEWQMFTLPRWNADVVAESFNENGGVTA